VKALIAQLKDKDEVIRLRAAKDLGKLKENAKDAIGALTAALDDSDDDVRIVAKKSLEAIKEALASRDKSKTYTSAEQLLTGMPKAKYPRSGEDGTPERKAANTWLNENVVGRAVEWPATIESIAIFEVENDRYNVRVSLELKDRLVSGVHFGRAKLGSESVLEPVMYFESSTGRA